MLSREYNLRGIVGDGLDEKTIKKFAKNVVNYIYEKNLAKSVIIGKDNRVSSDYILSIINAKLLSNGIKVFVIGESSSPELSFLTKRFKFSLGIMITASHNSWEYNGLKCFDINGDSIKILDNSNNKKFKSKYEKIEDISNFKELYLRDLKDLIKYNKIRCVFDCSNGATIDIVRKIFPKQKIIGDDKTGEYINNEYGSEHLNNLQKLCKKNKILGFAFDGDGDRVVAVDCDGTIIDGDKILYILATQYLYSGDKVVGTYISSLGLELSLRKYGIGLIREKVGAGNVSKRVNNDNLLFGGETCGHVYFSNLARFDGVAIAILLLNILNRTGFGFKELLSDYKEYFKLNKNINLKDVKNIQTFCENNNQLRCVVRESKTEPLIRVQIEAQSKELAENKLKEVLQKLGVE